MFILEDEEDRPQNYWKNIFARSVRIKIIHPVKKKKTLGADAEKDMWEDLFCYWLYVFFLCY